MTSLAFKGSETDAPCDITDERNTNNTTTEAPGITAMESGSPPEQRRMSAEWGE